MYAHWQKYKSFTSKNILNIHQDTFLRIVLPSLILFEWTICSSKDKHSTKLVKLVHV